MTGEQSADEAADATCCLLDALVRTLSPPQFVAGARRIDPNDLADLTTAEAELVRRAVHSRRVEFASGRALLRSLLGQRTEILRSANGAPQLPDGWTGSLSHDQEFVVALIGPDSLVRSVGIDMEPIQQLGEEVARLVTRPDDSVRDPLTAFVSKEAVYKAWSAIGGEILEHHEVQVVANGTRFTATVRDALSVCGDIGRACDRVVAVVAIPATR